MSTSANARSRRDPDLPLAPTCADCGARLSEPYGWCSGCRKAFCFPCGRGHYCTPQCPTNGCLAGLCVRVVQGGILAKTWGLPPE